MVKREKVVADRVIAPGQAVHPSGFDKRGNPIIKRKPTAKPPKKKVIRGGMK